MLATSTAVAGANKKISHEKEQSTASTATAAITTASQLSTSSHKRFAPDKGDIKPFHPKPAEEVVAEERDEGGHDIEDAVFQGEDEWNEEKLMDGRQVELCFQDQLASNSGNGDDSHHHQQRKSLQSKMEGVIVIPNRTFPEGDAISLTSDLTGTFDIDDDEDDDEGDDQQQKDDEGEIPDFHKLLKKGNWEAVTNALSEFEDELKNAEGNNALDVDLRFQRSILKRNKRRETVLHTVCYKAPIIVAQEFLAAVQRHADSTETVQQLLHDARDPNGNTILHLVCAHVSIGGSASGPSSKRRSSKHKSKSGKSARKIQTIPEDSEEITESTADLTEVVEHHQQNETSRLVLDLTILKALVLLSPEMLSMTNKMGDTPLHLLVSSPGFCSVLPSSSSSSSKRKKKKGESSTGEESSEVNLLAAEMAAEEALASLLDVIPHEIAMKVNQNGRTLLHNAIATGAYERVLVQIMKRLPFCASVPDARGLYPLHYVAAFMGSKTCTIPWTFAQDLISAYPAALISQTHTEGDTPLHSLLYAVQQRKHEHDEKLRKRKNKSSSNRKEFYLDRSISKLAELLVQPTEGGLNRPTLSSHRQSSVIHLGRPATDGDGVIRNRRAVMNEAKSEGFPTYKRTSCPDLEHLMRVSGSSLGASGSGSEEDRDEQRQDGSGGRKTLSAKQKSVRFDAPSSSMDESDAETSAMMIVNHDSLSPLHCCAMADTPEALIQLLLDKSQVSPRACVLQTPPLQPHDQQTYATNSSNHSSVHQASFGATPLHLILARPETKDTVTTIELFLGKTTSPCAIQDSNGLTPLAVALLNPDLSASVLKSLIRACKMAAGIPTHDHHWPLHLAFQTASSPAHIEETVYRALIQASPSKSLPSMITRNGDTPLHVCCAKPGMSKKIVKLLLEKHDGAKFLRNKAGKLPSDLATQYNPHLNKEVPQLVVLVDGIEAMYV